MPVAHSHRYKGLSVSLVTRNRSAFKNERAKTIVSLLLLLNSFVFFGRPFVQEMKPRENEDEEEVGG